MELIEIEKMFSSKKRIGYLIRKFGKQIKEEPAGKFMGWFEVFLKSKEKYSFYLREEGLMLVIETVDELKDEVRSHKVMFLNEALDLIRVDQQAYQTNK